MKSKVAALLPIALLIISPVSLIAQQDAGAREYLTTADRSALLAEQKNPLPFSSPANAAPTIDVNDMQQYQSVDRFGFALTGGSAQLLMRMDSGPRADLVKQLFDPAHAAVSYLGVTIGASDIVLVASNTANFPRTFHVKYHGRWFTTTLPEESVGSYVW